MQSMLTPPRRRHALVLPQSCQLSQERSASGKRGRWRGGQISSHCFLEGRTSHCVSRAGKQEMVFPLRWIHPGTMNGVSGQKQIRTPSDTVICVFKCVLHSRFGWARKTCKQLHLCGIHCETHMRKHGASSAHAHMRVHRSSRVGTFGRRYPYYVALYPGSWPASSCRDP